MAYALRRFRTSDAPALVEPTLAAIRALGTQAYTSEQFAAWAARNTEPDRFVERVRDGADIIIATDSGNRPVAYALLKCDIRGAHLDMLYCHPDHARRGLAARPLAKAEERARNLALDRLFTEASELARPTFERAGYSVLNRRDFNIEHQGRGVPIHNYAMEKRLA